MSVIRRFGAALSCTQADLSTHPAGNVLEGAVLVFVLLETFEEVLTVVVTFEVVFAVDVVFAVEVALEVDLIVELVFEVVMVIGGTTRTPGTTSILKYVL